MDENRFWILASKKIAGEISADETAELELLYIHHPEFKEILRHIEFKNHSRQFHPGFNEEKILKNLRTKIALAEPSEESLPAEEMPAVEEKVEETFWNSYKKRMFLSGAVVLLLVTFGAIYFTNTSTGKMDSHINDNNIATKPGSKSQVKLPDGTLVILNADSKLSYPDNFLGDTREVTLEGEAFFDVTENKQRPFIIHLKTIDIKVLGTMFNVKAYPTENTAEASLIRGSIEVTLKNRRNEKIMLKPNEKISVSSQPEVAENTLANAAKSNNKRSNVIPLISVAPLNIDKKENIIREIGWTQNKLMFKNEDLESITLTLQRWYGQTILIRSEKLKDKMFTGNFHDESLLQVLEALQASYNFNYKSENNSIIIF